MKSREKVYDNVAVLLLSVDDEGTPWVHLGVELRGRGAHRKPVLSTFGGAIDTTAEGKPEHPIVAALRETNEESLHLFANEINFEHLQDTNKTFSMSYVDRERGSNTVLFATLIRHDPELSYRFASERDDRIHKRNGKRFHVDAETEMKAIRSVKLDDLKAYLADAKNNGDALLKCAEHETCYLSLDGDSKIYNNNDELLDYEIWSELGKPIERNIPTKLNLRIEQIASLAKMMPLLEKRLLNTPLPQLNSNTAFFGKSIRADEFSFFNEFIDTTPVAGARERPRKSRTRMTKRKDLASRGTELLDIKLKRLHGIGKQYSEREKLDYTGFQSLSYYSVQDGTPVFGWSRDRSDRLLGVVGLDVLPNRFFIYDTGTKWRTYEGHSKQELLGHINKHRKSDDTTVFDLHETNEFVEKVKATGKRNYNEVLGRIRWNVEQTSICVFSDNIETRWIAIDWARKAGEKYKTNVKITYYDPEKCIFGEMPQQQIEQDIKAANEIFHDQQRRDLCYLANDFEFLLILDDVNDIRAVLEDNSLMKQLLQNKLFIAESLIEKYIKLTNKTVSIDFKDINFKNFSRSFLEKIANGNVLGLKFDPYGRLILSNVTFTDKDLSNMDLSMFYFEKCHFTNVYLRNTKLSIKDTDSVSFTNCDFTDTDTSKLNFQNCNIYGNFIHNDTTPNLQVFKIARDTRLLLDNYDFDKVLMLIEKSGDQVPKQLLLLGFAMAAIHQDRDTLKHLFRKVKDFALFNLPQATDLINCAAIIGDTFIIDAILARHVSAGFSLQGSYCSYPIITALQNNQRECAKWILNHSSHPYPDNANYACEDNTGKTPILCAAMNDDDEMVKLLLQHDPSILLALNYIDHSPLAMAALLHNEIAMQVLINNGATLDICRHSFIKFASEGNEKALELLIKYGISVDTQDSNESTALVTAIAERQYNTAFLLLEAGADPNIADNEAATPLCNAILAEHEILIRKLLPITDPKHYVEAMISAAKTGRDDLIQEFVALGTDIKAKDFFGSNIIISAATCKHTAIIDKYIHLYTKDELNNFMCDLSALVPPEMLVYFVDNYATNVNAVNTDAGSTFEGITPLLAALNNYEIRNVQKLLELGADPNFVSNPDESPIIFLFEKIHEPDQIEIAIKMFQMLYANGMTIKQIDFDIFFCLSRSLEFFIAIIQQLNPKELQDALTALCNSVIFDTTKADMVKIIIDQGKLSIKQINDVYAQLPTTISHYIMLKFIKAGANINALNEFYEPKIVNLLKWDTIPLFCRFIDDYKKDMSMNTLNGLLCKAAKDGYLDAVKALLDAGANPLARNHYNANAYSNLDESNIVHMQIKKLLDEACERQKLKVNTPMSLFGGSVETPSGNNNNETPKKDM